MPSFITAPADGPAIAYEDRGAGNAVLFIHGHPFNRSMWAPQIRSLEPHYRVLAPDLRGYGESSLDADAHQTTLETFAGDAVRLLDALRIERACVAGLSMGGQIAMEFARAFPERTAGLVLAATFPQAETEEGVRARNSMADRLVREGMAGPGCETLPKMLSKSSLKADPAVAARVYEMMALTNPRAAAAALRGRALRRDYTEPLSQIRVPALIVVGTEDAYTTVEEAESMHRRIAGSRLEVFAGAGHMPNLEQPQRFNDVLSEFLKTVWGS